MSPKYERVFVVAVPVARAWAAFADPEQREAWMGALPSEGFEPIELKPGVIEPHRRLTWSQRQSGLEGWYETAVTFEEVSAGTRITIVRSGFGDSEDWRHYSENTGRGWDESIADLILYLETGLRGSRHLPFRSSLGATMLESPVGVRVTHIVPGGYAATAGMRAGDLILRLNGAAIVHGSDVCVLMKEHAEGEVIEAEWVRDAKLLHGRAPLSGWLFGRGTHVGFPGAYPKAALAES